MASDSMDQWYALHTSYRSEKKVAERISEMAGMEAYLPLYSEERVWSDRRKTSDFPLFPQTVFVRCSYLRLRFTTLIKGVVEVVSDSTGRANVVTQDEILEIRRFLSLAKGERMVNAAEIDRLMRDYKPPLHDSFIIGKGTPGVSLRIMDRISRIGKNYRYLSISSLNGSTVCIELRPVDFSW